MFVIAESVLALRLSRARSGPWLFDKLAQATTGARDGKDEENFFIPIARNPLKRPDSKK